MARGRVVSQNTQAGRVRTLDKQLKALELRKAGYSYFEIAAAGIGYNSKQAAAAAVKSALKYMLQEPADEVRQMEVARLDALLLGVWDKATGGDIAAGAQALRIMERRAKLLGLDAPTQTVVDQVTQVRVEFADDPASPSDAAAE